MNITVLKCFFIFSALVELGGALQAPPLTTERITRGQIANSNNIHRVDLGLFRPYQNQCKYSDSEQEHAAPKLSSVVKRISQKLKILRSALAFRLFSVSQTNKKRFLSILAAGIIAAGTFPSHVIAEIPTNPTTTTELVARSSTSMDSEIRKSMAKNAFLQYDQKAPNNYFEDVAVENHFDTNLQTIKEPNAITEEIDSECIDPESDNTIDASETLTDEIDQQEEDDVLIINDRMVKNGVRNIAIASTGTAALLALTRKVSRRISDDGDDVDDDVLENIIPSEKDTEHVASCEADTGSVLPLSDRKYVKARRQPKSRMEESMLAARYAAIPTVEERAYQIVVDLGMIEVH